MFYLSGTGSPRFSWKRGHLTGVCLSILFLSVCQSNQSVNQLDFICRAAMLLDKMPDLNKMDGWMDGQVQCQ